MNEEIEKLTRKVFGYLGEHGLIKVDDDENYIIPDNLPQDIKDAWDELNKIYEDMEEQGIEY